MTFQGLDSGSTGGFVAAALPMANRTLELGAFSVAPSP